MLHDLTCHFPQEAVEKIALRRVPLRSQKTAYTGMVYDFPVNSMYGSYIDFPGHIAETDDGLRADNARMEDFFRIPCTVIHLDYASGGGAVSRDILSQALNGKPLSTPALMLNALGQREPDEIATRSVWLDDSAVQWLINSGIRLLVSDIFESPELEGVFLKLFAAGISTVCEPRRMAAIRSEQVLLTVSFLRIPTLCQLPCQLLAEED